MPERLEHVPRVEVVDPVARRPRRTATSRPRAAPRRALPLPPRRARRAARPLSAAVRTTTEQPSRFALCTSSRSSGRYRKKRSVLVAVEHVVEEERRGLPRSLPEPRLPEELVAVEERVGDERRRDRVRRAPRVAEEAGLDVEVVAPAQPASVDHRVGDEPVEPSARRVGGRVVGASDRKPRVAGSDEPERLGVLGGRDAEQRSEVDGRELHRLCQSSTPERRAERQIRGERAVERVVGVVAPPVAVPRPSGGSNRRRPPIAKRRCDGSRRRGRSNVHGRSTNVWCQSSKVRRA